MGRNSCSETRTHTGLTPHLQVIHVDDGSKLEREAGPHGAKKALGLGVREGEAAAEVGDV